MKKIFFVASLFVAMVSASAQDVCVPEPEFVNSYFVLTSDSTSQLLPKEMGTIGAHTNKVKKYSKIVSKFADVAGSAGIVGMSMAGSSSGILAGLKTASTASSVGTVAETTNALAGSNGMDIILDKGKSDYQAVPDSSGLRFVIRVESNEYDPMDCYRIVRFKTSKKERRIQWLEFEADLLGTEDAQDAGYVGFTAHKYGEQSYLLNIPSEELTPGEYGIILTTIASPTFVPVGTFSVPNNNKN